MSAHASGQLARERARGWHTVAHQWRLPVATVPSAGLAVIKFRSWRSKNLTWQLEFSLDLPPQISFHRSVGVIFFWYVVQRRPLLDQADQLVFGFFGPDRHVLRIFAIFYSDQAETGSLRATHALMPRSLVSRVAFGDERCWSVTAADPTLTKADGERQMATAADSALETAADAVWRPVSRRQGVAADGTGDSDDSGSPASRDSRRHR